MKNGRKCNNIIWKYNERRNDGVINISEMAMRRNENMKMSRNDNEEEICENINDNLNEKRRKWRRKRKCNGVFNIKRNERRSNINEILMMLCNLLWNTVAINLTIQWKYQLILMTAMCDKA